MTLGVKESAVAKSRGSQDERHMSLPDATLLQVLRQKTKIPKKKADYRNNALHGDSCAKCKFNLGDESSCHIVRGKINNETGISKFFSPKGDGMLPGDVVWMHVKQTGYKLKYSEGHVINKGARGFQCKNCKYYLFSHDCLLIEGKFSPKMSCGYIVKQRHGTRV